MQEVSGSIPLTSTNETQYLQHRIESSSLVPFV
jgi:hypothetical protein